MTYRLYMTIELPGAFTDKEAARDAAVATLQNAVTVFDTEARAMTWGTIARGDAIECRVFEQGKALSGEQHAFIIDICDGAI
jgi:hypothetical protein